MTRYIRKGLAALLCICLVLSFAPVSLATGTEARGNWSAGTVVSVKTVSGVSITSITEDFAAPKAAIKDNDRFRLVVVASGAGTLSYSWSYTAYSADGTKVAERTYDELDADTCPLYKAPYWDDLADDFVYVYTVEVTDEAGKSDKASVTVAVSDGYADRTLKTNDVIVSGPYVWELADLSADALDETTPAYSSLQRAADGQALDGARQISLVNAGDSNMPLHCGKVTVSIPVSDGVPADATAVKVVALLADGTTAFYDATVQRRDDGIRSAVFTTTALGGAYAVAYDRPGETFVLTATSGDGGSITPEGETQVPEGGSQTYVLLPDAGYKIKGLRVGDSMIDLAGSNRHTVTGVSGNTSVHATFEKVAPDPKEEFSITANVVAGKGGVSLREGEQPGTTAEVSATKGSSVSVGFFPEKGWTIDTVTVGGVSVSVVGETYLLSAVERDTSITVAYKQGAMPPVPTFTLTSSVTEGEGTIDPVGEVRVLLGGSQSFTVSPKQGNLVKSVIADGQDVTAKLESGSSYRFQNVVADHSIAASFKKDETVYRTVTAEISGGHGSVTPATSTVPDGGSALLYFHAEDGYVIDRVTLSAAGGGAVDVTSDVHGGVYELSNVRADCAVTAVFAQSDQAPLPDTYYVVEASSDGHGRISPAGETRVRAGGSQTFSFLPDDGYVLREVLVDGAPVAVSGLSYTVANVSANMTVKAVFAEGKTPSIESYAIEAVCGAGGTVSPAGTTAVIAGASVSYALIPEAGFELDTLTVDKSTVWKRGSSSGDAPTSYRFDDVRADHTIAATFVHTGDGEVSYCTVTASVDGGHGAISPSGQIRVAKGATQSFSFLPDEGYVVDTVKVGTQAPVVDPGSSHTIFNVKEDTSVVVTFRKHDGAKPDPSGFFEVNASATAGGTVSPSGSVKVARGAAASFSFQASQGYELYRVDVDDAPLEQLPTGYYLFGSVTDDHKLRAFFKKTGTDPVDPDDPDATFYTVTPSSGTGGSITPSSPVKVKRGGSQTFTFAPDSGKRVASITVNGKTVPYSSNSYTLSPVNADASVAVAFEDVSSSVVDPVHSVAVTAGEGGRVSPAGTMTVADDGSLAIAITPDEGWTAGTVFVDGAAVQRGGTSYLLADVRADHTVRVEFERQIEPDPEKPFVDVAVRVHATAEGGAGGAVHPSAVTGLHGSSHTFYVFPEEGYDLERVEVDGMEVPAVPVSKAAAVAARASRPACYSFTVENITRDLEVNVTFRKLADGEEVPVPVEAFEISAHAEGPGTVSPSGDLIVPEDGMVRFTFTADPGYVLKSLTVGGVDVTSDVVRHTEQGASVSIGSYLLEGVSANAEVVALFGKAGEAETFHVLAAAVAGGHGTVVPSGEIRVLEGADQTFSFMPDPGYQVDAVAVDGQRLSYAPSSYTFASVSAPHSLEVSFAPAVASRPISPVEAVARRIAATGDTALAAVFFSVASFAGALALFAFGRIRRERGPRR